MAGSKELSPLDAFEKIQTVELKVAPWTWALRVRADVPMTAAYGRHLALAMRAQIASLPQKRYLRLHATWKDGAREALYIWLQHHHLARVYRWASKRWPVKWTLHDAALLFPAVSLPEDLQYAITHQIAFLDQQLPVFTGGRREE